MDQKKLHILSLLAALTAATIFGMSFMFSKMALVTAAPTVLLAFRFTVAVAAMSLVIALNALVGKVRGKPLFAFSLKGKPVGKLLLLGIVQPVAYFIFENYGILYTSAAVAGTIIAAVPVCCILMDVLVLHERVTRRQVLCALGAIGGVALISVGGAVMISALGLLFLLLTMLSDTVYYGLSHDAAKRFTPFEMTYVMFVVGMAVFIPVALIQAGGISSELITAPAQSGSFWLAVLYLGVLYARWRQDQPGFGREFRTAFLGGIAFYVVLPLSIYIASYLPYWWRDPGFSLADWWRCQVSMYNYHSTLEATHPFESRWYTWLLGLRPVWYYRNAYLPAGLKASIAGMAGPVIWLGGLAALLWLLWRQVSGRGSYAGAGVLILYGTQLIPWMLVSRCTFLYHYFPSSMFCLAALALALATAQDQRRAKRLSAALCAAALVLFVWYYPALSGLPIAAWRADLLNLLPSFGFY